MMVRHILGKPFEWLMRLFYNIHLTIDQNSEWYCLNQEELDTICDEFIRDDSNVLNLFGVRDGSIDYDRECDCI
jgi:hypothetical protein